MRSSRRMPLVGKRIKRMVSRGGLWQCGNSSLPVAQGKVAGPLEIPGTVVDAAPGTAPGRFSLHQGQSPSLCVHMMACELLSFIHSVYLNVSEVHTQECTCQRWDWTSKMRSNNRRYRNISTFLCPFLKYVIMLSDSISPSWDMWEVHVFMGKQSG